MHLAFAALKVVAFSVAALAAVTSSAFACSCERNPTAAGILSQHQMVFTGIVRNSVAIEPHVSATTFEVTEGFKGVAANATVVVRHPNGPSASCGVQFAKGQSFTVAAQQGAAGLSTTLCSTWMFLPHVGLRDALLAEMRRLNAPAAPAGDLKTAAAQASGPEGWHVSTLPDGRLAAFGIGVIDGKRYVVALACGVGKRPELAIEPSGARTLLVETSDGIWAFPADRPADALAAGLIDRADGKLRLAIDDKAFPAGADAVDAFERIGKDCEQRSGWQYGQDDDQQMLWIFRPQQDGAAPFLTFGKPATGWLLADLSCEPGRQTLVVRSTALPRGAKNGQAVPFKIRADGQEYSASARIQLFGDGDVAGFVVARLTKPQNLLEQLRKGGEVTLVARDQALEIQMRGAVAMLSRFERACGF
ncbi:MAG: hypothetical protein KIT48_09845 [Pseudolabrys sp.]|nr:hypothetical protein [Pseudolabrys sp.]